MPSPRLLFVAFALALLSLFGCSRSTDQRTNGDPPSLLALGTPIPKLSGIDQHGIVQQLVSNDGKPLIVYFYPKDGTPGCTKEACAFRDVWQRFEQQKVRVIGVSHDDEASHEKFAREHNIPFSLIADSDASWAKTFGVPSTLGKFARISFLFDKKGYLARVYRNVDPGVHATDVLRDIAALP
jgi:peroxiredoxin Q/BCP